MFVLINKTTKQAKEWGGLPPAINDFETEQVVEVSDVAVPRNINTEYMKVVGGKILAMTTGEKTSAKQIRKTKLDSDKWDELKVIFQDNLAELKTLLGI